MTRSMARKRRPDLIVASLAVLGLLVLAAAPEAMAGGPQAPMRHSDQNHTPFR